MIISREYIGTQTVAEAFVPIISEDIRKKIAEGDTFDNEGLCADIFTADYHLHWCFWHDTLSLFICFLILAHT